jgi:hypothetical protein
MRRLGALLKRTWATVALAAIVLACGDQAPNIYATSLTISLTYTYSTTGSIDANNNYPACTQAVTTNCITGFNVYDTTGSTPALIAKLPNASPASGTVGIIQTVTLTGPTPGTHTAVARTAYIGADGTAAESVDSAPTTFVIPAPAPSAPASLVIKVNP